MLLLDLIFLKMQNMHPKLLCGEFRFVSGYIVYPTWRMQNRLLDCLELIDVIILGFARPRWNLSFGRLRRQAWFGWSWNRWMSPSCNASLLWTDFIGRSYKRSSGIRSLFVKIGTWQQEWANIEVFFFLDNEVLCILHLSILIARLENSCTTRYMGSSVSPLLQSWQALQRTTMNT